MDTPNQYIEQCKKAFEIQELWVPTLGDNAVHKYYNRLLYIVIYIGEKTIWGWDQKQKLAAFKGKKDLLLWIPLLHQLFNIFKIDCEIIHRNDGKVEFWVEAKGRRIVDSIEQGLLMAIMKEKFNKEWNSENKEWVKNA